MRRDDRHALTAPRAPHSVVPPGDAQGPRTDSMLGVLAVVGLACWLASALVMCTVGRGWSLDLRVYLAAGRAFLSGHAVYSLSFTAQHLPFSYPPFALAILSPISELPTSVVEAGWWVLDAVALTATLWIALASAGVGRRARWQLAVGIGGIAALALEPVRSNIDYGQINVVLMLMVVADLLAVKGRGRGLLVGIAAAIKLTPLYFVLYFLVTRDTRALRNSVGSFAVLTGVSWLLMPSQSDRYFLHELRSPNQFGGLGSVSNQAWAGILHRTPFSVTVGSSVLWIVLCLATTVVVCWLAARVVDRSPLQAAFAIGLGSLLVSPLSWSHHWCWLVLLPIVAWQLRDDRVLLALNGLVLLDVTLGVYLWFRRGASRSIASSVLVLLVAALLVWWLRVSAPTRGARGQLQRGDP